MLDVMEVERSKAQAPGCFGAASVFATDGKVCSACVAYQACGEESAKTLEAIRGVIDVTDILARHAKARLASKKPVAPSGPYVVRNDVRIVPKQPQPVEPVQAPRKTTKEIVKFEITDDQKLVIANIASSKTREQAVVLCKQNALENAVAGMHKGINPFATRGQAHLRVTCDALINGGFTKASLTARLMQELSWEKGTAASHVAMACALVKSFNLASEVGGHFSLIPAVSGDA